MNYTNYPSKLVNSLAKPTEGSRIGHNESSSKTSSRQNRKRSRARTAKCAPRMAKDLIRYEQEPPFISDEDKKLMENLRSFLFKGREHLIPEQNYESGPKLGIEPWKSPYS